MQPPRPGLAYAEAKGKGRTGAGARLHPRRGGHTALAQTRPPVQCVGGEASPLALAPAPPPSPNLESTPGPLHDPAGDCRGSLSRSSPTVAPTVPPPPAQCTPPRGRWPWEDGVWSTPSARLRALGSGVRSPLHPSPQSTHRGGPRARRGPGDPARSWPGAGLEALGPPPPPPRTPARPGPPRTLRGAARGRSLDMAAGTSARSPRRPPRSGPQRTTTKRDGRPALAGAWGSDRPRPAPAGPQGRRGSSPSATVGLAAVPRPQSPHLASGDSDSPRPPTPALATSTPVLVGARVPGGTAGAPRAVGVGGPAATREQPPPPGHTDGAAGGGLRPGEVSEGEGRDREGSPGWGWGGGPGSAPLPGKARVYTKQMQMGSEAEVGGVQALESPRPWPVPAPCTRRQTPPPRGGHAACAVYFTLECAWLIDAASPRVSGSPAVSTQLPRPELPASGQESEPWARVRKERAAGPRLLTRQGLPQAAAPALRAPPADDGDLYVNYRGAAPPPSPCTATWGPSRRPRWTKTNTRWRGADPSRPLPAGPRSWGRGAPGLPS